VERFDKKQEPKHDNEGGVELIPEDRESQKRLCDEKPKTVIEPLATTLTAGIQVLLGRTSISLGRRAPKKIFWTTWAVSRAARKPKLASIWQELEYDEQKRYPELTRTLRLLFDR
jgi:hypothetical protein